MRRNSPAWLRHATGWALIALVATPALVAQQGFGRAFGGGDPVPHNLPYDGRFIFARLTYTVASGGYYYRGFRHGRTATRTPRRICSRSRTRSACSTRTRDGSNVLAITDPELFKFPVAYMTEAGYWVMSDEEVAALRKYLLKGGFLILDDTRDGFSPGNMGWANIEANFKRDVSRAALRRSHRRASDLSSLLRRRRRSTSCGSTTIGARRSSARCSPTTIRTSGSWCW